MKILELSNYSEGGCGVWQRVKQEAQALSEKGHQVAVFSSNLIKGSDELASPSDEIDDVIIMRFPAKQLGGESYMKWDFEKQALNFNPDIIIAHVYRHPHTIQALDIAKKTGAKVFLVAHAPFIKGNTTRSLFQKLAVKFYDAFIGPKKINKFDKVIAITKWEEDYLLALGCKKDKITYLPNGIPEQFFTQKKTMEQNKILFLGRISPVKDLETLITAFSLIKDNKTVLEIVGPSEEDYLEKLNKLLEKRNLSDRVIFTRPIYDLKQKIQKIDSSKIFVLPSKREAMPQALIEAMARKKIVIAANNQGAKDIIRNNENGFLFQIGNAQQLAKLIDESLKNSQSKLKNQAKQDVEKFSMKILIPNLERLF